jgi:hypothetical protein
MIVYVKNMTQLDKDDLAQMNEDYFKSLKNERLIIEGNLEVNKSSFP